MKTMRMKLATKLLAIIFSVGALYISCNGNHDSATAKNPDASVEAPAANSTSNSSGDASYSYTIDGKNYSGTGTNEFVNAARTDKPGVMSVQLAPVTPGALMPGYGFYFEIENKPTVVVHADENSPNNIYFNTPEDELKVYHCKEITVNITSSAPSRFTGTFSGTLTEPGTNKDVAVTDGKFDLPVVSPGK